MRFAIVCALAAGLAGCNTMGANVGSAIGSTAGAAIGSQVPPTTISKAQNYAKLACSILPAAESLRALFVASNGALATASQLAEVACQALTTGTAYTASAPVPPERPKQVGDRVEGTVVVRDRDGRPMKVSVEGKVVKEKGR